MSLKELQIRDEYRSDAQRPARQGHRDRLIQDFYIPCLEQATTYDRAVGFFSSSSMAAVAQGLTAFIHIAFTGSANESLSALIDNFECLDYSLSGMSGFKDRHDRASVDYNRLLTELS